MSKMWKSLTTFFRRPGLPHEAAQNVVIYDNSHNRLNNLRICKHCHETVDEKDLASECSAREGQR